jgi:hypothetical protein
MASYDRGDIHTVYVHTKKSSGQVIEPDAAPRLDIQAKNGGGFSKLVDDAPMLKLEDGIYYYEYLIGATDPYTDYIAVSRAIINGITRQGTTMFSVQVDTAQVVLEESGYGISLQYTKGFVGAQNRIQFKAPTGRVDVKINIYDTGGVQIVADQPMTELGTTGVYYYLWTPVAQGEFVVLCETLGIEDTVEITVDEGFGSIKVGSQLV